MGGRGVPRPIYAGGGWRVGPRWFMGKEICKTQKPELKEVGTGHCVACHFYEQSRTVEEQIENKIQN